MSVRDRVSSDEGQIRGQVLNWAAAVRRRDMEAILSNHAQDVLLFDVPPPLRSKGIDAYRQSWELFFRWAADYNVFDVSELEVTASDTVAFCHGIIHCAGRNADSSSSELRVRLTIGLRKVDGRWVVTHEHHSEPSSD